MVINFRGIPMHYNATHIEVDEMSVVIKNDGAVVGDFPKNSVESVTLGNKQIYPMVNGDSQ